MLKFTLQYPEVKLSGVCIVFLSSAIMKLIGSNPSNVCLRVCVYGAFWKFVTIILFYELIAPGMKLVLNLEVLHLIS